MLAGCAPDAPPAAGSSTQPSPSSTASPVAPVFQSLADWASDDHAAALATFKRSCGTFAKLPADRPLGPDGIAGRAGEWQAICTASQRVEPSGARAFFETWFRPHRVTAEGREAGFYTGYYEPMVNGARQRGGRFTVPLYGRPGDLGDTRAKPYLDRTAIERGAMGSKAPVLFWLDDSVDAFFLQVQGSGQVRLPDGQVVRVGYAADNGHRYVPIGRVLVQRGMLKAEEVSLQSIRAWLRANPAAAPHVMHENPRFIFFRIVEGEGPVGSAGVALTPGRSLAIDPAHAPLGMPIWIDTTWPTSEARALRRLMIAQDTGAAIKGPGRGDIFWGAGAEAELWAGLMKQTGAAVLLVPARPGS
jgi:membrane-bound lytic murein transglycosylase A